MLHRLAAPVAAVTSPSRLPGPQRTLRYLDVRPDTPYYDAMAFAAPRLHGHKGDARSRRSQGIAALGATASYFEHVMRRVVATPTASTRTCGASSLSAARADFPLAVVWHRTGWRLERCHHGRRHAAGAAFYPHEIDPPLCDNPRPRSSHQPVIGPVGSHSRCAYRSAVKELTILSSHSAPAVEMVPVSMHEALSSTRSPHSSCIQQHSEAGPTALV